MVHAFNRHFEVAVFLPGQLVRFVLIARIGGLRDERHGPALRGWIGGSEGALRGLCILPRLSP